MNKLLKLSAFIIVLILSACSSDDEPEPEYTGPWEIVYDESYYGLHNDSQDFREWFINHSQYLEAAQLQKLNGATWTDCYCENTEKDSCFHNAKLLKICGISL